MSLGLVLKLKQSDGVVIECPDGSMIRVVVSETSSKWAKVAVDAPLDYHLKRKVNLLKEGSDVLGGRVSGESVLSAARLGGGMGDEIADVEGGV